MMPTPRKSDVKTVTVTRDHFNRGRRAMKTGCARTEVCAMAQAVQTLFPGATVQVGACFAITGDATWRLDDTGTAVVIAYDKWVREGGDIPITLPVTVKLKVYRPASPAKLGPGDLDGSP